MYVLILHSQCIQHDHKQQPHGQDTVSVTMLEGPHVLLDIQELFPLVGHSEPSCCCLETMPGCCQPPATWAVLVSVSLLLRSVQKCDSGTGFKSGQALASTPGQGQRRSPGLCVTEVYPSKVVIFKDFQLSGFKKTTCLGQQ